MHNGLKSIFAEKFQFFMKFSFLINTYCNKFPEIKSERNNNILQIGFKINFCRKAPINYEILILTHCNKFPEVTSELKKYFKLEFKPLFDPFGNVLDVWGMFGGIFLDFFILLQIGFQPIVRPSRRPSLASGPGFLRH